MGLSHIASSCFCMSNPYLKPSQKLKSIVHFVSIVNE